MTSNKKYAILYSRKQEPISTFGWCNWTAAGSVHLRRCTDRTQVDLMIASVERLCWIKWFRFSQDHGSERQTVNTLHSLRNIRQAAKNSGRSRQTRKERVPWAYWISRAVAIGSAVSENKRIGIRTNGPSDQNLLIYKAEPPCHMENGLTFWILTQGYHTKPNIFNRLGCRDISITIG